jgi:hypothetical protein
VGFGLAAGIELELDCPVIIIIFYILTFLNLHTTLPTTFNTRWTPVALLTVTVHQPNGPKNYHSTNATPTVDHQAVRQTATVTAHHPVVHMHQVQPPLPDPSQLEEIHLIGSRRAREEHRHLLLLDFRVVIGIGMLETGIQGTRGGIGIGIESVIDHPIDNDGEWIETVMSRK